MKRFPQRIREDDESPCSFGGAFHLLDFRWTWFTFLYQFANRLASVNQILRAAIVIDDYPNSGRGSPSARRLCGRPRGSIHIRSPGVIPIA